METFCTEVHIKWGGQMNLENSRVVCNHVLRGGVRRDYEAVQLGLPSLVFLSSIVSFPQAAFRRPPT